MTKKEYKTIDIMDYISDEKLKELGYTDKESFQESNTKLLLEAMLMSTEKTIKDETKRLMKEHSLSYGEARGIATEQVLKSIKCGLKREVDLNE